MNAPIGFVGLGQMGLPMARRLLAAGHRVLAIDRRDELRHPFEVAGGQWATSPRALADICPVVLVSLPTPAAVESVALSDDGLVHGRKMTTYIDLSTTGPQVAQKVAEGLAQHGVVAIDAPVSGGVERAEQGTLAIMVSGPRDRFEALRPLLGVIGSHLFHVGERPGMGQLMKLINNMLSTTALAATYEVLTVGAKAGMDPKTMLDVLAVSSGTNHAVENKIPKYVLRDVPIGFSLDLSLKDVMLGVEAGEAMGVPMRMVRVTEQIWQEAVQARGPKQDYLQVVRVFEDRAGVRWTAGDCTPQAQAPAPAPPD